ncbi:hypothetical protein IU433_31340 [Nocardia puris]|uniref:Uncharacterized protein n=1 Tax=Nocardia puris TaxID=208602 RepID=A0A366CYT2_9NOCA|nr:hypothetical protein [Nocardia puris]MBF6215550.1 hypothetical protein [Nocardia puris]MBF6370041.1 hypothetical protein [Nocardia puris]MBF6463493.1 hypothetical protein [Nocardia puris]RBO82158.1 hypothetical protein DFR74_12436 [Nocardia puris]
MTHGLPTATPTQHRTDFEGAPTMADHTANTTLENAIRRATAVDRRTNPARARRGAAQGIRHSQIHGGRPTGLRRAQGR